MKYLVTSEEMKRYDKNTIDEIGIPGMVLMERAALCVLEQIIQVCKERKPAETGVLILAGMGNNGGDGLALARLLAEQGYPVTVWCVGEEEKASEQWKEQRRILRNFPVTISSNMVCKEYNILVDALFGVGLSREVTGKYKEAIEHFNGLSGYKIAVDVPSGLDADSGQILGCAVKADMTVTFGFCKRGLVFFPGCEYTGRVITTDIGITERSFLGEIPGMYYYDEPIATLMPQRRQDGNKGTFGKALVVAGSLNMAGAAILAAKAAYRMGAGMVKVITSAENRVIMQETLPEALLGTSKDLEESLEWADVILIGPGMGKSEEALYCLQTVIEKSELPLVIDADGLNLLAEHTELQQKLSKRSSAVIVTPHVGELSRLFGEKIPTLKQDLAGWGMKLATKLHGIVVAKDAHTFVCKENIPVCVNLRGNSGMATAGSGDVLAGAITGLLAQKMDAFEAAGVGVTVHATAGDEAALCLGEHGVMAGDIMEKLGCANGEAGID